jgi:TetR/AcrR family fatty acid metabolism transcriptional regulator
MMSRTAARRGKTRTKRTGDKRERILDAAVAVFAKTGFHSTRVADVAKSAGVADGTIYLYFDSKEDLLVKLFEDRVERLLAHLRAELPKEKTATGKIRRIVELQLGILESERELAEVLTIILRQSTTLLKEKAAPKFGEYIDAIAEVVAKGQKSGELRANVSPHTVARAIFGALDGLAMTWALGKAERGGLVRAADQLADVLLHGLAQ